MNLLMNPDEMRLRAGWRLLVQLLLAAVFAITIWYPVSWAGLDGDAATVLTNGSAMLLSIAVMARYVDRRSVFDFGLQVPVGWRDELLNGMLMGLAAMAGIWALQWSLGYVTFDGFGWSRPTDTSWLVPIVGNMTMMAVVGFYEEFWSRGYQTKVLSEGLHVGAVTPKVAISISIAATSCFFGFLHMGNPNVSAISIVTISLAGIMLALPYLLTGRLWVSIGLHFSWNFFQGAIFGFPVSGRQFRTSVIQTVQEGPDWFTGGAFGPEAGMVGILAMILISCWIYVQYRPTFMNDAIQAMVAPPPKADDIKFDEG